METNETIKEIRKMMEEVREMQQDLDAYNYAFVNIIGHLKGLFGKDYKPAIMENLAISETARNNINQICEAAFELRREYEKLTQNQQEHDNQRIHRTAQRSVQRSKSTIADDATTIHLAHSSIIARIWPFRIGYDCGRCIPWNVVSITFPLLRILHLRQTIKTARI